jgi:Phosphotransferase enzyme family
VLPHSDIGAYLLDAGLVDRDVLAAGRLRLLDVSGRNRVVIVTGAGARGYVVKQSEARGDGLLAREIAVLGEVVAAEPRLAPYVPAPISWDAGRNVVVYELLPNAIDISAYHARGCFPPMLGRRLGRALALLHGLDPAAVDEFPLDRASAFLGLPATPPSLEVVLGFSDAAVQLLKVMQGSAELCDRLAELDSSWRETAVVHGDARPSNCLAFPRPGSRRRTRLALVDWETARAGDPHLDLGVVFGEHLHTWLWSMSVLDGRELSHAPRHARHPLRAMHPAIRAFWHAYLDGGRQNGPGRRPSLRRAVQFSAGHLVAVAFERAQSDSTLDPRSGLALQLSLNMLRRPTEAAVHLLGLPVAEAAT